MLRAEEDIYCGIFDSSILRKNTQKSQNRTVNCFELELFHTDTGTSYVGKGKYPVKRGMLLFTKPGQIRHSDFPVRCSFIRIFPDGARREAIEPLLSSLPDCLYVEDGEQIDRLMSLFRQLAACFISSSPIEELTVKINGLFFEILYRCLRLSKGAAEESGDKPVNRIARDAYEYINEHYTEPCSLSRIADALNVSPNYLHTVFVRHVGLTPLEYLTQKRVDRAKKLIMAGEQTMLEIALELGFCSQSHFNKVFKERVGVTPVEYRKGLWEQY